MLILVAVALCHTSVHACDALRACFGNPGWLAGIDSCAECHYMHVVLACMLSEIMVANGVGSHAVCQNMHVVLARMLRQPMMAH